MDENLTLERLSIGLRLASAALCLGLVGLGLTPAQANTTVNVNTAKASNAGQWKLLGQTHANHSADHDTIMVQGPFDNFRRLKFKVTDAPLNMQRMVVTYDNGAPDKIDIRQNIPKGGESRVIDLKGVGKRSLRRIDFWYDTKGLLNGKADVTVFGMK
jgi:hypothetical protein